MFNLIYILDVAVSEEQCGWNNFPVVTAVDRKYYLTTYTFLYRWSCGIFLVQIKKLCAIKTNLDKFQIATPLVYLILKSNLPVYSILASAGLNEEQQQIQQMATDFATKELLPNMSTWDQQVTTIRFLWAEEPFVII